MNLPGGKRVVGQIGSSSEDGTRSRYYMVDSGASLHVVSYRDLTVRERRRLRKLDVPLQLTTANGATNATHTAEVYVRELDITVVALVLGSSPPLLSLGKLCTENGFRYVWGRRTSLFTTHRRLE